MTMSSAATGSRSDRQLDFGGGEPARHAWRKGLTASVRLRYFGPRDLIENGSQRSAPVTVVNTRFGYDLTPRISFGLEVLNLLNAAYNDAEYYSNYRLKGQPPNPDSDDGSYLDHTVHAGEPREFRGSITCRF